MTQSIFSTQLTNPEIQHTINQSKFSSPNESIQIFSTQSTNPDFQHPMIQSKFSSPNEPIQIWAPAEEIAAGRADYAALIGPPIIQFYEDRYGKK